MQPEQPRLIEVCQVAVAVATVAAQFQHSCTESLTNCNPYFATLSDSIADDFSDRFPRHFRVTIFAYSTALFFILAEQFLVCQLPGNCQFNR